jgi:thiamine-monophosphate kinase
LSDTKQKRNESLLRDEFKLIEKLLHSSQKVTSLAGAIRVPAGDDACLLTSLSFPVVTTDTQKEDVHFKREWQTPEEIGQKAVAVTLSDLAASYARPVSLFINLSLPPTVSTQFIEAMYRGITDALEHYQCALGGGNVSKGKEFSVDLFAIGEGSGDIFPKRSGAKPGFGVYVTGPLGLARGGLEALLANDADFPNLVRSFKAPQARFDAANILAVHGVSCVMDVSDGLSGDASHMAKASGITISLNLDNVTFDKELAAFCRKYNQSPMEMALAGGEDYELLFACPPDTFHLIQKELPESYQVGTCLAFQKMHVLHPEMGLSSFQHAFLK